MDKTKERLSSGIRKMICSSMEGTPFRNGRSIQNSMHEEIEFLFVIEGSSRFMLNHKFFALEPGDMVVIDSWDPHALRYPKTDHDLLHLWLHLWKDDFLGDFLQIRDHGEFSFFYPTVHLSYDISDLIRRRCKMAREHDGLMTESSVNRYLRSPLNLVLDDLLIDIENKPPQRTKENIKKLIDSVKQYINSTHGCHCSLSDLEKYSGYNKFYLSHLFKEETGVSIGEYVNETRIKYTVEAEQHGMRHADIAREIGYSSHSAFCQWLSRHKNKISELKQQKKRTITP